jgi:hypothetical protein
MTLRVVGAGLARTGTASLKLALEQLLGGPCYHMFELFANPARIPAWHEAPWASSRPGMSSSPATGPRWTCLPRRSGRSLLRPARAR